MGTQPYSLPASPRPQPPRRNATALLIGAAAVLIFFALIWSDLIEYIDGQLRLKEKHERKFSRREKEPDEAIQYALVALQDGWYPCLHSGRAKYYLRANEVWRYGVTTKGERGRYSLQHLKKNGVSFMVQFRGTLHQCLIEEQRKLTYYPILPENLARPEAERLPRPPYNPIRR